MIRGFINIRYKQILRAIIELGLIRVVFLGGALMFVAVYFFSLTAETPNVIYAAGAYLLVILLIHTRRADKTFLKSHFARFQLILLTEYFLMIIPLIFCLLYHTQWIAALISLAAIVLISGLEYSPRHSHLNTRIQKWIPADSFEWKSGIRKSFYILVILWLAGLATSFFIGSVPIALFIIGLVIVSFYERGEPLEMLLSYEMNSRQLIWHKIKRQVILFSILAFPLMAAYFAFHYERWYIIAVEYALLTSLHIYMILTKYAFYTPNTKPAGSQMFAGIGAVGTIIPLLTPVVWILSVWFYFRSQKNLSFYLDDFN